MTTSTGKLLQCVLREPDLVSSIQSLEPTVLAKLVDAVGLEDAGELLAMATTEQFVSLVDASLWTADSASPREVFDHARFVVWLEVMWEGGEELVVQRLHELPEETLVVAFSGQLLVLDIETLGIGMAGASRHEAELVEKALDGSLYLELENYTLVARQSLGWDVVIDALLALDREDHALVVRVLDGCSRASTELIDDEGLAAVLSVQETLEADAAAGREARRAARGFIGVADATAFLRLAAQTDPTEVPKRDAITSAYFRELDPEGPRVGLPTASRLMRILQEHGVIASTARALSRGDLQDELVGISASIRATREAELMYLANVLVASPLQLSPVEAAQQAVDVCGAGLHAVMEASGREAESILTEIGADQLFRIGWSRRQQGTDDEAGRLLGLDERS